MGSRVILYADDTRVACTFVLWLPLPSAIQAIVVSANVFGSSSFLAQVFENDEQSAHTK